MRVRARPVFRRCCLALSLAAGLFASASAAAPPGLDELLGGGGRARLQAELEKLTFAQGKTYSWQDYSGWGRELFVAGQVRNPPVGAGPSRPISDHFTCARCHNSQREDPVLPVQDPEARFQWIEREGKDIFMLQGATLWGGVNRKSFYAGDYAKYHGLCVPDGEELLSWWPCGPVFGFCLPGCRTMDPRSLVDATQVCSNYCSVGRYLEAWELSSLLAFFWDLELKLEDLELAPQARAEALAILSVPNPDPREAQRLREVLAGAYAGEAGNTHHGRPRLAKDAVPGKPVVEYSDGLRVTGDDQRGASLWRLSCGHCHEPAGRPLTPEKAGRFSKNAGLYYAMIANGTRHRFSRYMPNFTLERLSRRQAADILAFLQRFAVTGVRP